MIEIDLKNNLHKLFLFIGIVSIFMFGYYLTPNKGFYDRMLKTRIEENYNGKVLRKIYRFFEPLHTNVEIIR